MISVLVIAKWVIVAVVILLLAWCSYAGWEELIQKQQEEIEDEIEFECRRAQRQKEFDRHAQAVARACLIDTCETIYLGRINHE